MNEVVILLSLESKENQRLLQAYLSQYHTIKLLESPDQLDTPFDLGIFDGAALTQLWGQVSTRKQSENALFLPILLVTSRAGVSMITRQLWRSIDEIIFTPIEKVELLARVEVLLRGRRTSLELASRNIQLQHEIVAHKLAEESLRASEERIRLLHTINAKLSDAVTVHDVLKMLVEDVFTAVGGHAGVIRMLNTSGEKANVQISKGFEAGALTAYETANLDENLPTTRAINTGSSLWIETAEEFIEQFPQLEGFAKKIGIGADAVIPLIVQNKVIGAMSICFNNPRHFTEEEQEFLQSVAIQCANALERARLYEEDRIRAAMEERQRLGRDLHDSVSQSLFSIHMLGQTLPAMWERDPEQAKELIKEITALTQAAISEMRVLLLELRPANLIRYSLKELFSQIVGAVSSWRQISISCTVDFEQALPEDVHLTLYRIAQEGLNNIIKHSKATEASLTLRKESEKLVLRVWDNGLGFDPENQSHGLGIEGMRERAALIGATLEIFSNENQGTEIIVSQTIPAHETTSR